MLFTKSSISLLSFVLLATDGVVARERWLERDGRAVSLYPRRFGQEQPAVIGKIGAACPGQVCGVLAGKAITPLLAAQPECSQQDMADEIIDASRQFDAATQANMIALAVEYRQSEKNTPPDFSTNPPTARNSVFCQKAPKNAELNGLVQAQDPANDPEIFFDPALKASVRKGTQANTAPFGGAAAPAPAPAPAPEQPEVETPPPAASLPAEGGAECPSPSVVTVTVTGANPAATNTNAVTITAGVPAPTAAPPVASPPPAGVDFGSCQTPEIEFGPGFDNRRETSFRPVNGRGFNQGSAQNINIITRAMCDQLTNTCRANQAAKDLCATAAAAAGAATPAKGGIQADAFNAAFGITTNFASDAIIDDQGRVVAPAASAPGVAPAPSVTAVPPQASPSASPAPAPAPGGATGAGDFGSCTVPEIVFAVGLDGRRETANEPKDKQSFRHSSAQNIDIITQFICDELTNSCKADQQAKDTCQQARAAASAAPKGTGQQADAFNAVFGIQTNFAAVPVVDNTGKVISGGAQQPPQNNGGNAGGAAPSVTAPAAPPVQSQAPPAQNNGNVQAFQGALGGVAAPAVTANANGSFQVQGNASFNNLRNALVRSCDVQNNQCSNAANASGNRNGFTVAACGAQQSQCISQAEAQAGNN